MQVYLVPGLASDRRIFCKLALPAHEMKVLELPEMQFGATIKEHASLLSRSVGKERHMLIGMSMGGMIMQEMAAITRPDLVIIISSWKSADEMPIWIKQLRGTHPERIVSKKFIDRVLPLLYWQMGAENDEDRVLIDEFARGTPIEKIKMQMNACLNWNGPELAPARLIHIHGDNDHLMPIGSIKGAIPVKDGGHFMVFNKADRISEMIRNELSRIGI